MSELEKYLLLENMDLRDSESEDSSSSVLSYCEARSSHDSEFERHFSQMIQSFERISLSSDRNSEKSSVNIDQEMSESGEDFSQKSQAAEMAPKKTEVKSSMFIDPYPYGDPWMPPSKPDDLLRLLKLTNFVPIFLPEENLRNKSLPSSKASADIYQGMSSSKPEVTRNSSKRISIRSSLKSTKEKTQPSEVCSNTNQGMSSSKPEGAGNSSKKISIRPILKSTKEKIQPSEACSNTNQGISSGNSSKKKTQLSKVSLNKNQEMSSGKPESTGNSSKRISICPSLKSTKEKTQTSKVCLNTNQGMSSGKPRGTENSSKRISIHPSIKSAKEKPQPSEVCSNTNQGMSSIKPKGAGNSSKRISVRPNLRSTKKKSQPSKVCLNTNQAMSLGKPEGAGNSSNRTRIPPSLKITKDEIQPSKVCLNTNQEMSSNVSEDEFFIDEDTLKKRRCLETLKSLNLHKFLSYLVDVRDSLLKGKFKCVEVLHLIQSMHFFLSNPLAVSANFMISLSEKDAYFKLITDFAVRKKFRKYGFLMTDVAADVFSEVHNINICGIKAPWKATFRDLHNSLSQFVDKINDPEVNPGYWATISLFLSVDFDDIPLNLLLLLKKYCLYIYERRVEYPGRQYALKIWDIFKAFCNQNSTDSPLGQNTLKIWDFLTNVPGEHKNMNNKFLEYDCREIEFKRSCYFLKNFNLPTEYPFILNRSFSSRESLQYDIRPRQFCTTSDFLFGKTRRKHKGIRRKLIRKLKREKTLKKTRKAKTTKLSVTAMDISAKKGSRVPESILKKKRVKLKNATTNVSSKRSTSLSSQKVPPVNNVEIYYRAMFSKVVPSNVYNYYIKKSKNVISYSMPDKRLDQPPPEVHPNQLRRRIRNSTQNLSATSECLQEP